MQTAAVLLVEDDPSIVEHLTGFLAEEGFSVRSASGQEEALDILDEKIMRCDSDSGKKLIKSMVLRTADRQGMC